MRASNQHPACTIDGCSGLASAPPNTRDGAPVCPRHAAELAGGLCVVCREPFDHVDYGVYADQNGRAVCIDCWAAYG